MKNFYYSLVLLIIFGVSANAQNGRELKFNNDGKFKIVQFTDTHIKFSTDKNLNVFDIIKGVIKIEQPDFVILTGDIITEDDPQKGYLLFDSIFTEANVPWAMVFGNHDSEHNWPREKVGEYLKNLPSCLNNDSGETYGNSNFVLSVYGKDSKVQALLYCMDSNTYSTLKPKVDGYGWFDFSQVQWYLDKSKKYTLANNGNPLPALAFFHIPLPEYYNAWKNKVNRPIGTKHEDECSPEINTGMFAAMLEGGDVMGTFVGHDHINDYIGVYYNIALAYGRVSKVMQGKKDPKAGGRVIVLKEGEHSFDTWIRNLNGKKELECSWPGSFSNVQKKK
ncbi:MAG: metallophosphoesterase family protein [Draconibacterium sp.]|nr:metallophosphoesterase family protein [Draconibacterium sp.]